MEGYYINFNYINYNEEKKRLELISENIPESRNEMTGHYIFKYFLENGEPKEEFIVKPNYEDNLKENKGKIIINSDEFKSDITLLNDITDKFLNKKICFSHTNDVKEPIYKIHFEFEGYPNAYFVCCFEGREMVDLKLYSVHYSIRKMIEYSFHNTVFKETIEDYFKTKSKYRLRILTQA